MILPYIDQAPVYTTINFSLPVWAQTTGLPTTNQQVVATQLSAFRCPTDAGIGDPPGSNRNIAVTNYSVAEGYHWWNESTTTIGGIFTGSQHSKMGDIVLSHPAIKRPNTKVNCSSWRVKVELANSLGDLSCHVLSVPTHPLRCARKEKRDPCGPRF